MSVVEVFKKSVLGVTISGAYDNCDCLRYLQLLVEEFMTRTGLLKRVMPTSNLDE